MKKTDSPYAGKVLLGKRQNRVHELEELEAQLAGLKAEVKLVEGQIAACRAYIRELDIRSGKLPDDRRLSGEVSIREMIGDVLSKAADQMTVTEIRKEMELKFGRVIERPSVSPILSKMHAKGEVRKEADARWSKT